MTDAWNWRRYLARPLAILWKLIVASLAVVGFLWLVGESLLRLVLGPMFVTEIVRREYSPDRSAAAEVEVRRGGMGTVWTTRVLLGRPGQPRWTIYESGDSDFIPPLRWSDSQTLLIGLPCGRFDHLSNPDDWESREPRHDRLKVRFELPRDCR